MLVLVGALPFWDMMRAGADMQGAVRGMSASVVGLLGAALYSPVGTSSINTWADFVVALVGFLLLTYWHVRPLLVVLLGALSGIALTQVG
jgi:chromate transporter